MNQTIGGPAAAGRPGDYLLENDRIRAIVHGRHNERGTFPLANGSLVDLDIQRPQHRFGAGKGRDVFYELSPMVNLQVNNSRQMQFGECGSVGAAPCPESPRFPMSDPCVRVSASGPAETFIGFLELLNFAVTKPYADPNTPLELVTDYDLCPGESVVRMTTTARFSGPGEAVQLEQLDQQTGLLPVLLGDHSGIDCAACSTPGQRCDQCPADAPFCDDILSPVASVALPGGFRRCRSEEHALAGVLGGDFMLFAAKASIFIPGSGFDNETYTRTLFDSGGDIFSQPLPLEWLGAVGDGVSYVYFAPGKAMVPVFADSFTASMTHRGACPRSDPQCLTGKELRFSRFVSVGSGDMASALAGFYRVRGIATGELDGHVIDVRSRKPLSGIDVFAFTMPPSWASLDDHAIAAKSYAELLGANREASRSPALPAGDAGMVSQFRTDVGLDTVADGSFSGPLPAGAYVLVVRDETRAVSRLVPLRITAERSHSVTVLAGETGRLQYDLRDVSGRPIPAKLTIGRCFAECAADADCRGDRPFCHKQSGLCSTAAAGLVSAADCRPDQRWDGQTCRCIESGRLPLELGGHRYTDGTERTVLSASGRGQVNLPPGTYEVIASRGIEYEISRDFVTVRPGSAARFSAALRRVVDTRGWVAADFHVHGPNSVDSSLALEPRVSSYAAEGVELLTATEHDQRTDYGPTIFSMGLSRWVRSQVGQEVSPLDYGHFLGFPLRFDETAELNGGFHWREDQGNNEPDWASLPPQSLFNRLREEGLYGPEHTVTAVAHFYDHFSFYDIDPWTLNLPQSIFDNVLALTNPVLDPINFSGDFDALEVLNGKNIDVIRRPTYREVRQYNQKLSQIFADPALDAQSRQQAWKAASVAAQRDFLIRTKAEQAQAIAFDNLHFECRCAADAECGAENLCDAATGGCVAACQTDTDCDDVRVGQGRERCAPVDSADPERKRCQRITPACSTAAECSADWAGAAEACLAADSRQPRDLTCQLPCVQIGDCDRDPLRPLCRGGYCQPPEPGGDDAPCPPLGGTLDDWFQLLNHGVRRTLLGNSDSHDLYGVEAGIPRTFVRSAADLPRALSLRDLADAVKASRAVATYGPFVEFSLADQPIGDVVVSTAGARVNLRIRVQSPLWFDVDRIEVYRNGQLIDAIVDCTQPDALAARCIALPNDRIVNYEGTLSDQPQRDSWYVVVAMGVNGKSLAPVYSSTPVARVGIFELVQRLIPLLPPLRALRTPFSPTIATVRPYAVTNPIWVDIDGNGLTPLLPPPIWATARDRRGQQRSGLRVHRASHDHSDRANHGPRSGHDHRRGLGRLKRDQQPLIDAIRQGAIDQRKLRRAVNALRHVR